MTTNNLRICFENAFDFVTNLAGGSTTPTNIQNISREHKLKRTLSGVELLILNGDFASLVKINFFAMFRHNMTATGKIRLKLYDAIAQGGSEVYNSGQLNAWTFGPKSFLNLQVKHSAIFFDKVSALSFELFIEDGSLAFILSRAWCGEYLEPKYNPQYGLSLEFIDEVTHEIPESGTLYSLGGGDEDEDQRRKLSLNLGSTTQPDSENLMTFYRTTGKKRDIFISVFPGAQNLTERNYMLNGKFATNPKSINDFYLNWAHRLDIVEV